MGQMWDLVQEWVDEQHRLAPSSRQVAMALGISQSTFSGWRDGLKDVPKRRTLWALHHLTHIPYRRIMDAAIEDAGLYDERLAKEAWLRWKASKGQGLLDDEPEAADQSGDALQEST